ncbi:Endonuclease-reverse transcriptase, partial [Schistosoma japonicum]
KEMEKAAALGNTRQLYRLIRETGIKKSRISEIISEKDDTVICSQPRRLERWAEHFKEHIGVGWKRVRGGQTKTWHQSLKSLTSGLSHIGRCQLPGWGPRDCRTQWLETLGDMAQNQSQWRRCIHSLSS